MISSSCMPTSTVSSLDIKADTMSTGLRLAHVSLSGIPLMPLKTVVQLHPHHITSHIILSSKFRLFQINDQVSSSIIMAEYHTTDQATTQDTHTHTHTHARTHILYLSFAPHACTHARTHARARARAHTHTHTQSAC